MRGGSVLRDKILRYAQDDSERFRLTFINVENVKNVEA